MLQTILRQPMAILGALGFVSLLSGVAKIHEDVRFVIDVFQTMTRPIWEWTIGPIVAWLGLPFPGWLKDYLTMGLIVGGASARQHARAEMEVFSRLLDSALAARLATTSLAAFKVFVSLLMWPMLLAVQLILLARLRRDPIGFSEIGERRSQSLSKAAVRSVRRRYAGVIVKSGITDEEVRELISHAKKTSIWDAEKVVGFFDWIVWTALILALSYGLFIYDAVK